MEGQKPPELGLGPTPGSDVSTDIETLKERLEQQKATKIKAEVSLCIIFLNIFLQLN